VEHHQVTNNAKRHLGLLLGLSIALLPAAAGAEGQGAVAPEYLSVAQLRAKYADRTGKIAVIRGVEIYYKDEGSGPVLLLMHGSSSSLRIWDTTAARLKSRYRVIRYDVGGMGLSGTVSDEAAASVTPVDIATGLLDQLGVKKLTFVGNSSGGTLGMFLAAQRPGMVERLILSNTPADPVRYAHMVQPESFKQAQEEVKQSGGFQSLHFWNEFMQYFSGRPERISPKILGEYYDFNRRIPEKHPIAMTAQIADGVVASQLMAQVTAPTLLIWGATDQLLPLAAMQSLARHLEKAQVSQIILPDVGHYPPLEVPERFTQLIAAYVEAAVPGDAAR
jgi:pimeloyl-ACP methyl ester carboxylesterase